MSKTNTTARSAVATKALSYDEARAARIAAEERHALAVLDVTTARAHEAAQVAALEGGNFSIGSAELAAATAEVQRAELVVKGARALVVEAQRIEGPSMAEHWSTALASVLEGVELATAQEEAQSKIAAALEALAEVAARQHATVRAAISDADAAGLIRPGHRVYVSGLRTGVRSPVVIHLDDKSIVPAEVTTVLRDTLVGGAAEAGYAVRVDHGSVVVEVAAE